MSDIAVVIPCWEAYGKGDNYLRNLLFTLHHQTFKNFTVCISDQSKDESVLDVCKEYADLVDISYYPNKENPGFIPNTNTAIELGEETGAEIVKVMFQDDFILTSRVLEQTYEALHNSPEQWGVCSFCHTVDEGKTHYNAKLPQWNDNMIRGVNTFSSPSILSMKKGAIEYFDENVTMLMDCEMYHRLYHKYGPPKVIDKVHISNREHQNQTSRLMQNQAEFDKKMSSEVEYCLSKHGL